MASEKCASSATETDDTDQHSRTVGNEENIVPSEVGIKPNTFAIGNLPKTPNRAFVLHNRSTAQDMLTSQKRAGVISKLELVAADVQNCAEAPKTRLIISHLVMENFKSYAGRQVIGPFHKSFSSVVGPNGSGKSNVIDSLLFVFGFRASKMRQGKISALIHNSATHPDLGYCSVEVHFEEIENNNDAAHIVVPDSKLVVARKAFKNNSSQYTINGHSSNFTEVTTLLKERGIDLEHKRFLILQGEVESIAQMKAKAQNEHDDGLLEYLEDIIGTSKYKKPIEEASQNLDVLNQKCLEKSSRVRIVEKERDNLEAQKDLVVDYIRKENLLVRDQNILYQMHINETNTKIRVNSDLIEGVKSELAANRNKYTDDENVIKSLDKSLAVVKSEGADIERNFTQAQKVLSKHECEEVKAHEREKHLISKEKKLQKLLQTSSHTSSESRTWVENYNGELAKHRASMNGLETSLAENELELEKLRNALKPKTQIFTDQIEQKQQLLDPWVLKFNAKESEIVLAQSKLTMLKEQEDQMSRLQLSAESEMQTLLNEKSAKNVEKVNLEKRQSSLRDKLLMIRTQYGKAKELEKEFYKAVNGARQQVSELSTTLSSSQSHSRVLLGLNRLKESGRLEGFHGRLGDLGTIDAKYDIAVSTACPSLENMVVDTVEAAQQGVEYLRKNNLGRAVFIVLGRLPKFDLRKIQTPENCARLFDLITMKDDRYGPAFYSVLQNTLVSDNLAQATRVAYGTKRWRVVSLQGNLIDKSGTMSGGGTRIARGAMSDKSASAASQKDLESVEQKLVELERKYSEMQSKAERLESELSQLGDEGPELEMKLSMLVLELTTLEGKVGDCEQQAKELRASNGDHSTIEKQKGDITTQIEKLNNDANKLKAEMKGTEQEIAFLQENIMAVGGIKLRTQKSKVDGLRDQISALSERISSCEVAKKKAEKEFAKSHKQNTQAELDLRKVLEDIKVAKHELEGLITNSHSSKSKVQDLEFAKSEYDERILAIGKELEQKQIVVASARAVEIETRNRLEDYEKVFSDEEKKLKMLREKLSKLKLSEYSEDGDADALETYSEDELKDFRAEQIKDQITEIEESLKDKQVDFGALDEYIRRCKEYQSRQGELEEQVNDRNLEKARHDDLCKRRLDEFMIGFTAISLRLKEMYQMITMGGNAELELVDSLDPFSEGIGFSVMPPKKSWKNISNLSGGEKTLSSLALVFALHHYKPTPLYVMDEIDAALDFRNVSIIADYIKERTKNAQFIVISLRNNMFELAARLIGIYKTANMTKSISMNNDERLLWM